MLRYRAVVAMNPQWNILLLVAGLCMAVTPSASGDAVVVTRDGGMIPLAAHVLFARDSAGTVGIEDREKMDWFGPAAGHGGEGGGFGYTSGAIWARVDIENGEDRDLDAHLMLSVARLGRVTWWVLDGERIVDAAEEGVDIAEGKSGRRRYPALGLHFPAREVRTVFLRVESDTAICISLSLARGGACGENNRFMDFSEFAFVGAGAAVFLMAFLLGVAHRNRLYFLLSAIVGAFLGYYMLFHRYYIWLGGPWQRWANRNLVLALGVAAHWAFLEFTIFYFRLSDAARQLPAWLRRMSIGVGAGGVGALCALPFRMGLVAMMALLVVCFAVGIVASFRFALSARAWPNRLLVVVWLLLALILASTYAELFAWLPAWMEPAYSQRAIMLSFFLMVFTIVAGQRQMEQRDRERAMLAEQSAATAQLQSLRYQLNPHFLYNTLTSIDALSREAPLRIPELVRKLATYLRLRLHPSADGMATVESELDSTRAYLDIEQVRFEESLRVRYEIGPGVETCRVPEMVFQPLVENAIKHGMPPEGALELTIRVAREAGQLEICVENNGHLGGIGGDSYGSGGGVGLRNVTERLARVHGAAARFELREEAGRVTAKIRLPIEEGET